MGILVNNGVIVERTITAGLYESETDQSWSEKPVLCALTLVKSHKNSLIRPGTPLHFGSVVVYMI